MHYITILWIIGSLIAGLLGKNRWIGFWGALLFALFFSPVLAIAALVLTHSSKKKAVKKKAAAS